MLRAEQPARPRREMLGRDLPLALSLGHRERSFLLCQFQEIGFSGHFPYPGSDGSSGRV